MKTAHYAVLVSVFLIFFGFLGFFAKNNFLKAAPLGFTEDFSTIEKRLQTTGGGLWAGDGVFTSDLTTTAHDSFKNPSPGPVFWSDVDFVDANNLCDDFKEATPCPGTGSVNNSSPAFTGTIKQGPLSTPGYYTNSNYVDQLTLAAGSPARDLSDETVTGDDSLDYNSYDRGAAWDNGAFEYGTTPGGGEPPATGTVLNGKLTGTFK